MQQIPLIIGYGSTLRGDDGFGVCVAERLLRELTPGIARILVRHGLTLDLAAEIAEHSSVYFIDATIVDTTETLVCRTISADSSAEPVGSHDCHPALVLETTRLLYHREVPAYLITCVGKVFEIGATLSPEVERNVALASDWITRHIKQQGSITDDEPVT